MVLVFHKVTTLAESVGVPLLSMLGDDALRLTEVTSNYGKDYDWY